jgi:spermidine/putrescine transport system substrate-binding protein
VKVSTYVSNEELLAKLQAGATGYDVAIPSDYMVDVMTKLKLLEEIDKTKIPNFKNLRPELIGLDYDPQNNWSVPYSWGTTGIAINTKKFPGEIRGWKDLLNNPVFVGQFTLLDDLRETFGLALKMLDKSLNTHDESDLVKAKDLLLVLKKRARAFLAEPLDSIMNDEFIAAQMYSSDAVQAGRNTNGKIKYILPEEGGTLWIDSLVIPKGAPHKDEANALINFFLERETILVNINAKGIGPVLKNIEKDLPEELRENKNYLPSKEVLSKFEMIRDVGDKTAIWDKLWTEIKASN